MAVSSFSSASEVRCYSEEMRGEGEKQIPPLRYGMTSKLLNMTSKLFIGGALR
jgi:hypothetical protein